MENNTYNIEINKEEYRLIMNALTTEWLKYDDRKKDDKVRAKIEKLDALMEKIDGIVRGC